MFNDKYFTIRKAARYLGIGEVSLRRAIAEGRLPYTVDAVGKLIKQTDLEIYKKTYRNNRGQWNDYWDS